LLMSVLAYPWSSRHWNLSAQQKAILALEDRHFGVAMREGTCFLTTNSNDFAQFDRRTCLRKSSTKQNLLLIGDSHAADLWPGLAQVDADVNVMQATASGCKPLIGDTGSPRCSDLMRFIFRDFLPNNHLDAILLSAHWSPEDVAGAKSTAEVLVQYADRVVLLGPAVEYGHPLPRTVTVSLATRDPSVIEHDRFAEVKRTDELFADRMAGSNARYFSVYGAICPPRDSCQVFDTYGMPLEFDTAHLTVNGSIQVARRMRESGVLGLPKPTALGATDDPGAPVDSVCFQAAQSTCRL
jgi:hypothetical protein